MLCQSSYQVHSFVCKKPRDGDWPVPTPTTIPSGHCKRGFTEFQGYCYKIMGFAEEKRDWHRAKDGCRDDFKAELASIHSAREAAKITTMLVPLLDHDQDESSSKIWIGAHEASEGIWWWSDESRWDFTNWAPGEPNDMYYNPVS